MSRRRTESHLAQAIGELACRAGYSTLYVSAHRMLSQLRASRADRKRPTLSPCKALPARPYPAAMAA